MNFEKLHKTGESQQLEFKESFGKETVETVAAFCNASGGSILIGVDKKGNIKGVTVTDEILKEWVNTIKQATQPQIFPEINSVQINGKTIVVVKVQEYPVKPVGYKGKYFKRVGASNHLLPIDEMVEMQLFSINSSFDSFLVEQKLTDLNMDIVSNFFSQLGNAGRITLHDDPVVNLKKIKLIKEEQLTFAALLLFGEHNTGIHIGRFKSPDVIIDDILIKSPLVTAVDEAMTFIKKNISLRYEFTGELRRKEIWQYPLPVIRELLLNAVIHKDYRNPTDIIIKIFDDHIRFINPGNLMGGLKPEDLLNGDYVAAHRNKFLAEAFYLRGDIEKFGTGFFRIQSEMQNYPELGFTVESVNGFIRSGIDAKGTTTAQDTAQDTAQVVDLLSVLKGEMSREEIQKKLKLTHRENFRKFYLRPALLSELIEMTIPDKPNSKNQRYRLTQKGKITKRRKTNNE
jgi:ATP-dependent DNA helicase RecG